MVSFDFGSEFLRLARGVDNEYFRSVGAFSVEAVAGLQRCCDGIERGRLRRRALTPTFKFFFSARGMAVFATFVKRWVDAQAGRQCIFSFCALWLISAKLYKKCYAAPPVFGRACGDGRWSAAEKVEMLRDVRDGLPRGIAAKVEPVKLVIERIVCVALKAQEKLARRDEAAAGKAAGPANAKTTPPKRARSAVKENARKDDCERPLAARKQPRTDGGWGVIPRKSPVLAPAGSSSGNVKAGPVKSAAKVDLPDVAEAGNVNEHFLERRGTAAVGSEKLNKLQALMGRKLQKSKAGALPPVSPLFLPSSVAPESPSPVLRHTYWPGGHGLCPPTPAIRRVLRLPDQRFDYDASRGGRLKRRQLNFVLAPTVVPIEHNDDMRFWDPSDPLDVVSTSESFQEAVEDKMQQCTFSKFQRNMKMALGISRERLCGAGLPCPPTTITDRQVEAAFHSGSTSIY